jgi:hypothetical protein
VLSEIVRLVEEHGRLTLREIASHFRSQPGAIEPVLDMLVDRGRLEIASGECSKGSCSGCYCADRQDMISYRIPG